MTSASTWALAAENPTANEPVQLVVGYKDGANRTVATKTLSSAGARVTVGGGVSQTALSEINASRVTVSKGRSAALMSALRNDPNVSYVERDVRKQAFGVPNDPAFSKQNEMYTIGAPQAWDTTTGSAVTVAVIDTGVNAVGDLAGAVLPGYDFVNKDNSAWDDYGHGTSVAALVAARGNNGKGMAGVCWNCNILPVKVLDNTGGGWDSEVAQGIIWAVQRGARILNLSLGGPESSKVLADAVAYANVNGALVVASAGNRGNTTPQYPAAYGDVLTVASSDRCYNWQSDPSCTDGTTTRSYYSSYNAPGSVWVDVAAPGTVLSMDRNSNYNTGTEGTSFAAPIVAGAAALIKSRNPSYSGWSLASSIYAGASKHKLTNGGVNYGLIDIPASLNVPTDTVAPSLSYILPGNGYYRRGTVAVTPVNLTDNRSGIRMVSLYVNGVSKGYDSVAPWSVSFNSAGYNGNTKVELRIYDKAGNLKTSSVNVIIDNVAPATSITSAPKSGSKVKGNITVKYTGSDQFGMNKYELLINGKVSQTKTATGSFVINTANAAKSFTVQVRGYDKAGNTKLSTKYSYTR
ncbi:S8 family serine peptidase [Actinoplanes solisilvae]|uniref:S8 family serine peptidase n=1 Tax=Actinoplanes solisilvae TaxID=2486853 RepID=UPI0013E371AB|nr:S8 family serine peptidase [Actinoplanes solisilvae]